MHVPIILLHFLASHLYLLYADGRLCGPGGCVELSPPFGKPYFSSSGIYVTSGNYVLVVSYDMKIVKKIDIGKFYEFVVPYREGLALCGDGCKLPSGKLVKTPWIRSVALAGDALYALSEDAVYKINLKNSSVEKHEVYDQTEDVSACGNEVVIVTRHKTFVIFGNAVKVLKVGGSIVSFAPGCGFYAVVHRKVVWVFKFPDTLVARKRLGFTPLAAAWNGTSLYLVPAWGKPMKVFSLSASSQQR